MPPLWDSSCVGSFWWRHPANNSALLFKMVFFLSLKCIIRNKDRSVRPCVRAVYLWRHLCDSAQISASKLICLLQKSLQKVYFRKVYKATILKSLPPIYVSKLKIGTDSKVSIGELDLFWKTVTDRTGSASLYTLNQSVKNRLVIFLNK